MTRVYSPKVTHYFFEISAFIDPSHDVQVGPATKRAGQGVFEIASSGQFLLHKQSVHAQQREMRRVAQYQLHIPRDDNYI
jgi:hypothetical protein